MDAVDEFFVGNKHNFNLIWMWLGWLVVLNLFPSFGRKKVWWFRTSHCGNMKHSLLILGETKSFQ